MQVAITSIGTANPSFKKTQMETAELISAALHLKPAEKRLLRSVYRATGIDERHSVLSDYHKEPGQFEFFPNLPDSPFPSTSARMQVYKDNALNLALSAIQDCFSKIDVFNKNSITHVITVSCTGMYAPGLDIEIVQHLQLNSTTQRIAVNFMGCYGAFNAIKIAHAICRAQSDAKVLIVSVELCTLHFQNNKDLGNIISNAIFSDGAAAALIEADSQQSRSLSLERFYCDLIPQTSKEMAWRIADSGFDIVLTSYVSEVIQSGILGFTHKLLNQHGLQQKDIDLYAIHPGGLKVLQACEEALNITKEQNKYSYQVLRQFGNMSSATILFVLKALWADLTKQDHLKNIFSCAFGPGLTLESMLLKVNDN